VRSQHQSRCNKSTARAYRALSTRRVSAATFCAGHPSILEAIPPDEWEIEVWIELDPNEAIRILGLLWNPSSDQFLSIKWTCVQKLREPKNSPVIKCIISSIVASIFDPLWLLFQLLLCTRYSWSSSGFTSLTILVTYSHNVWNSGWVYIRIYDIWTR